MRKYWKLILVAVVIIGIAVYGFSSAASKKAAEAVTTDTVRRGEYSKVLTSSGKTKAERSVDLKFQTSGRLAWVGVKEGDTVNAWTAVAGLDSRDVQKTLEKSLRDYRAERNDFDQASLDSPAIKPSDAANDRVKRILEKNQWDLDKAVLDVELKKLAVEFATLVTPIAGIVTHVDTPIAGVNITPATAVFSVADPSSIVFEATVDETDVAGLAVGTPATVMLDAYPDASFSGTITRIAYTAQQSAGGATVFPVNISISSPEPVRIGLNGDIEITTERQTDVLLVPAEAVRDEKGKTYAYRKSGSKYVKVPVTVGKRNEDTVIITSGLSEGDTVVTKGFSSLPK